VATLVNSWLSAYFNDATFGLSRFASNQSGWATARAWFFGAALAGTTPTVETSPATTVAASTFFKIDIIFPFLRVNLI
jgi:hypothetical protein